MPMRLGGLASGIDTDAVIKEMMSAQSLKRTKVEQNKEKLEWKKEKWEEMNTKIYSLYTEKLSSLKLQGSYLTRKAVSTNEDKAKATATNASDGVYSLTVDKLATAQYVTGASVKDKDLNKKSLLADAGMITGQIITVKYGEAFAESKTISVDADTTIEDFINGLKEAGFNASFDDKNGRFFIASKESGLANAFTIESNVTDDKGLAALGLEQIDATLASTGRVAGDSSTMAVVGAGDLVARFNGAYIEQSSNTLSVAGLSVEISGTTAPGEAISITVNKDTDAIYDKVKDFVTSYNELLKAMQDSYSAPSAKGYSMLTEEEKDAMSEKQVELWENKIKDSLLRRDSQLEDLISTFRASMNESVEIDGEKYSLSSLGIVTGAYTENGQLHINGNPDDKEYEGKKDSLRSAIDEDPEKVGQIMSKIMGQLYDKLTKKMSANSVSSALTLYNDKMIKSQIEGYEKEIARWDSRLADIEDRYYKQFASMESAMTSLQQKQSQLAGLFGMTSQ